MAKEDETRIDFYGRVVDDRGVPVEGVEVMIHIAQFTPNPMHMFRLIVNVQLKTDKQGLFEITDSKGYDLSIESLKRAGYEWGLFRDKAERNFEYKPNKKFSFIPDPKKPVTFVVRKKGEETFIINPASSNWGQTTSFTNAESGIQKACDLVQGVYIEEKNFKNPAVNGGTGTAPDLVATATRNPKTGAWTFVLSAPEKGGLLLSDELLYEAPADGYQPSLTFKGKLGDMSLAKKHLYFRVRAPWIYGRLSLEGLRVNQDECWMEKSDITINPYGERNLEAAANLPGDVSVELRKEAREALYLGRRPAKPDLPNLIREWKKGKR